VHAPAVLLLAKSSGKLAFTYVGGITTNHYDLYLVVQVFIPEFTCTFGYDITIGCALLEHAGLDIMFSSK
jgi:hypothetical protein